MTRIFVTRPLPSEVIEALDPLGKVDVRNESSSLSAPELARLMTEYDVILPTLGDDLSAAAFPKRSRCRLLANFGVGYNHIDVATAQSRGITVTNTPGAVTDATADIAITLMLMVARRAGEGERLVRAGRWQGWHPTQMLGMHLGGKTLGIIGMGRIGRAVARRAHFGLGMEVVFYNRSAVGDCGIPGARQMRSIAEVMALSDVVSINVPGGPENRHLIGFAELVAMKTGAILVNTARGDVIDERALITALLGGKLMGAGLDVYENEPEVPEALRGMENVVLLPHLGTNALEVRTEMGLMAVDNIRAFLEGKMPPNVV
ncbi:MAG: D-glycerate dehydrogenase [Paracoccaceae bacterium]|nr:D-glycerate dehydrogenase [Paracoccaceae bacterium]